MGMDSSAIIDWLRDGDVSVRYQTERDLLGHDEPVLAARIATEGWGARFLAAQNEDGNWGGGFYRTKWISSHYTLLDLKLIGLPGDNPVARNAVAKILREEHGADGSLGPGWTIPPDVCIHGMFLDYACHFGAPEADLRRIIDYVLTQQMGDGGFNCRRPRGAHHSSMHSTLSVLEGILSYRQNGYRYRLAELEAVAAGGREFLLMHRLFRSDHTGEIIREDFLKFAFPPRWKYNILRALDYFWRADCPLDPRTTEAIDVVLQKRRSDGRWNVPSPHSGKLHFEMEKAGQPSRWNTLIALRVLGKYRPETA